MAKEQLPSPSLWESEEWVFCCYYCTHVAQLNKNYFVSLLYKVTPHTDIIKTQRLPVPDIRGSSTIKARWSYGPQEKLEKGSALTLLTAECTHYVWFSSERSTGSHQTGNKDFSWLWHSSPGRVSSWWRQWVNGPKWSKEYLESYLGQDSETKAKGCCGPQGLHKDSSTAPSPQALPEYKAQQREALCERRMELAQWKPSNFPKAWYSRPHPRIFQRVYDPTKKMNGTILTVEQLGKIQDAYSES